MTDGLTRRSAAIGGLAALLTAGSCAQSTPTSMIQQLRDSGLTFLDSERHVVNLAGLQARLNGNPSTLTFQFASCGDVCPMTGIALGQVAQDYPNVKHVVISTQPQFDRGLIESRLSTGYARRWDDTSPVDYTGLRTHGPDANTIVLYPSLNNNFPTITDDNTALTQRIGELQQRYFNLPTGADPAIQHTGTVLVYNGQGNLAGQVSTTSNITTELPTILDGIAAQEQRVRS